MSRYTIDDNFYPKYDITKSMVGPLPLALHHDYLQYMYHANGVKTGVLHVPLCLKMHELAYISPTIVIVKTSSIYYQLFNM